MNDFLLQDDGVWYSPLKKEGDTNPQPIWICSPLEVTAITRDHNNDNHGRLLRFFDSDGNERKWAMPMQMTASEGVEYRRILLSLGLNISSNRTARNLLTTYIQSAQPKSKVRCVSKIGWFGNAFVFPTQTIGECDDEAVVFQANGLSSHPYEASGTLEEWKKNVAHYCVDNSRLVFAVCAGFAAPLLSVMQEEGGGFHFRGKSSGGKTTALRVGGSVFGGEKMISTWRATSNGMESVAVMHNDCLLCLDELGQLDPKDAGDVAYLLANGSGKSRASKDGFSKDKSTWKVIFLSSGEIGLSDHMWQARKRSRAGQEIRIVDIPADTQENGIFEYLHGFAGGAEFSRELCQNTQKFHGTAGPAFISAIAKDPSAARQRLRLLIDEFVRDNKPPNADGQVVRVLHRMALVAAAGRLATEYGITGWPEEDAFWAVSRCFNDWIVGRGGVSARESQEVLKQARRFFELHGESRFSDVGSEDPRKTFQRAGFKKNICGKRSLCVLSEVFKTEVCEGLDPVLAAKILSEKGWLIRDSEGKSTRAESLPGFDGTIRCYCFDEEKVLADDI